MFVIKAVIAVGFCMKMIELFRFVICLVVFPLKMQLFT